MTVPKTIRVLIADDHLIVRRGLGTVIQGTPTLSLVGEASTGEEAIFLCQKHKPDVVLMDIRMSGLGGIEATQLLNRLQAQTQVIGLSSFAEQKDVTAMFAAGARGYLLKDVSAEDLVNAISRVHAGEVLDVSFEAEPVHMPAHQQLQPELLDVKLGDQQTKVLALMTKGFTNPEIAQHMAISRPTVSYHVSAILRKLDVSNRSEAVALAIRTNLIGGHEF